LKFVELSDYVEEEEPKAKKREGAPSPLFCRGEKRGEV
jgi:hypothetical protein